MVDKKGKRPRAAVAEEEAGPAGRVAMKELRVIQQELEKVVLLRLSEMPNFWLSMLLRHPKLENVLMFSNQKIFNYFESLNVEELEVPRNGYYIKFPQNFKQNPYFENEKPTKTIEFSDDNSVDNRHNHHLEGWL